jgi:hypothetical protein
LERCFWQYFAISFRIFRVILLCFPGYPGIYRNRPKKQPEMPSKMKEKARWDISRTLDPQCIHIIKLCLWQKLWNSVNRQQTVYLILCVLAVHLDSAFATSWNNVRGACQTRRVQVPALLAVMWQQIQILIGCTRKKNATVKQNMKRLKPAWPTVCFTRSWVRRVR